MKIDNGNIYKIKNKINNKKYIGLTTLENPRDRFRAHISIANGDSERKSYIHRAIAKYGKENFTFKIIESGFTNFKTLCEREVYYIEYFNTYNEGYNLTLGGEGTLGHKSTNYNRSGKPVYQIDIDDGSIIRKYDSMAQAARELNTDYGSMVHAANNVVQSSYGYIWVYEEDYEDFEFDREVYLANGKPVLQLDKDTGDVVGRYVSAAEASRQVGAPEAYVGRAIRKGVPYKGFVWFYEKDYDENLKFDRRDYLTSVPVLKISSETLRIVGEYDSITEAENITGINSRGITRSCNNIGARAGGYYWSRYKEYDQDKFKVDIIDEYLFRALPIHKKGSIMQSAGFSCSWHVFKKLSKANGYNFKECARNGTVIISCNNQANKRLERIKNYQNKEIEKYKKIETHLKRSSILK